MTVCGFLCERIGESDWEERNETSNLIQGSSLESKRQGRTICRSYLPTCNHLSAGAGRSVGHNLLSVINFCSGFQIGRVITYLYCRDAWRVW